MALSVSTERTVLWDQIQYTGDPAELSWVLPVKPGAVLELASDAFFEALDAGTSANIVSPAIGCPVNNNGGGDDGFQGGGDYSGGSGCNAFSCLGGNALDAGGYGTGAGVGGAGGSPPSQSADAPHGARRALNPPP